MKPGPELDALIAEKVMGISQENPHSDCICCTERVAPRCPRCSWEIRNARATHEYSTKIGPAWEVVEKMASESFYLRTEDHRIDSEGNESAGYWYCNFVESTYQVDEYGDADNEIKSLEAPHAICLAALKAKGVDA